MDMNSTTLSTPNATSSSNPMDWLFGELHGMFGNKLLDAYRSGHTVAGKDTGIENMRAIWAEKIRAHGLKIADVRKGIAGCERLKWPPTWGEFIELCRPVIDISAALNEGIFQMRARQQGKDIWSDAAIFWASVEVGEFDMLSQPHASLMPRFKVALMNVMKTEVKPIPPRVPAIAYDVGTVTSREKGQEQLKRIGAFGAVNKKPSGIAWAHRMLQRVKSGERIPGNGPDIAARVIAERGEAIR